MFLGVPERFFYEVLRFFKKNFFLMLGKKIPGWSDCRKIGESRNDRAHPAEMAKFMKIHGFNQIERARSPRSEEVSRSCWVFLTGFSMKF